MAYNSEISPEIYTLAQKLMAYTGESLTQTILNALAEKLEREQEKGVAPFISPETLAVPDHFDASQDKPFSKWWAEQRSLFPTPQKPEQYQQDPRFAYLAERYDL